MRSQNVWTTKPWQRSYRDLWTLTAYRRMRLGAGEHCAPKRIASVSNSAFRAKFVRYSGKIRANSGYHNTGIEEYTISGARANKCARVRAGGIRASTRKYCQCFSPDPPPQKKWTGLIRLLSNQKRVQGCSVAYKELSVKKTLTIRVNLEWTCVLFTHFGVTRGITQGFRVIPEVTPKLVNNTNVHSKFTPNSR